MLTDESGYFLIQLSTENEKPAVWKEIGENIRRDANGVKQVAFIGVTNPTRWILEWRRQRRLQMSYAKRPSTYPSTSSVPRMTAVSALLASTASQST